MESKYTNPNGDIVLERKRKRVELFFFKIEKIAFRNESYKFFFQEVVSITQKTTLSITLS